MKRSILDQPAQVILLTDDIYVVGRICGGWNKAVEVAQIFGSADLLQLISTFESLFEREKVDWIALSDQLEDQAINNYVFRNVERFRAKAQNA